MTGILGSVGIKTGLIPSNFDIDAFNTDSAVDGIVDIGNMRMQLITFTTGGSASDWGQSYARQARYYMNITGTFGYTYPSIPRGWAHMGPFDSHVATIATVNLTTTGYGIYAHSADAATIQSKAGYVLVIGDR